jgi:hypothetical protein
VGEHERAFVKIVFSKTGKHDRFSTACWGHDQFVLVSIEPLDRRNYRLSLGRGEARNY